MKTLLLVASVLGYSSFAQVPTQMDGRLPSELSCTGEADSGVKLDGKVTYTLQEKKNADSPELLWIAKSVHSEETETLHLPVSDVLRQSLGVVKVVGTIEEPIHDKQLVYILDIVTICPTCPVVLDITDTQGFKKGFTPNCTYSD